MTITVSDLQVVTGKLKGYKRDVQVRCVEACSKVQTMIANDARQIVPVDTGALQHSIQEGGIQFRGSVVSCTVFA
ncbi:MAG: hypothetical protein ACWGQW_08830, partial [bacterium]